MAEQQHERVQIGLLAVAAILVAVVGWFFVASPWFSDADTTRNHADSLSYDNRVLSAHVADLRSKHLQVEKTRDKLVTAREALPVHSGLDAFTRQLADEASSAQVRITSVVASTPAALTPAATDPNQLKDGHSSAPAPAPQNGASRAVAGQVYSMQVVVLTSGPGGKQLEFLHAVQNGPRAALVTSVAIAPKETASVRSVTAPTTMTLTLQIFVQPQASAGAK